jgi:hypothetical protein
MQVHCLWFHDESDLNKIAGLLQKVEAGLPKQAGGPPDAAVVAQVSRSSRAYMSSVKQLCSQLVNCLPDCLYPSSNKHMQSPHGGDGALLPRWRHVSTTPNMLEQTLALFCT